MTTDEHGLLAHHDRRPTTSPAPRPTPVLRADDPHRAELEADGWTVVARSWGARLLGADVDVERLRALVAAVSPDTRVRPLDAGDVEAVLALDRSTLADYPGGPATAHAPLTGLTARPGPGRYGFGAFVDGALAAMTFLDRDGGVVDTEFTVVAPAHRGHGLASAVKAASVLALLEDGATTFRTGGAAENDAILRANTRLGYVVDERWLTYALPPLSS